VRTARALRQEGFTGRVVLVGLEAEAPYDKPPLTKRFLTGALPAERIGLLPAAQAEALGIDLRTGVAAVGLDLVRARVELADGSDQGYDELVIATGARPRPSPWGLGPGVYEVRSLADAEGLRAALAAGGPVVVVGAGFIGSEVAATARELGCEVTLVDPAPGPMSAALGPRVSGILAGLHTGHGVDTRFGVGVDAVVPGERPLVELADGTRLEAATVVVGLGAVPNDEWLAGSGLDIDGGVVCDQYLCARGADRVHAVGDVCRWLDLSHGGHRRVEHWTNAVEQARCVAHNICHPDSLRPYEIVDFVWTELFGHRVQLVGTPRDGMDVLVEGPEPGPLVAYYSTPDGVCRGVVTLDLPRVSLAARTLLRRPVSVDEVRAGVSQTAGPRSEP
jgi:phthalate 3,4-dioxygenase ferredoxin reductase subunit